jgi:hypothetical protein
MSLSSEVIALPVTRDDSDRGVCVESLSDKSRTLMVSTPGGTSNVKSSRCFSANPCAPAPAAAAAAAAHTASLAIATAKPRPPLSSSWHAERSQPWPKQRSQHSAPQPLYRTLASHAASAANHSVTASAGKPALSAAGDCHVGFGDTPRFAHRGHSRQQKTPPLNSVRLIVFFSLGFSQADWPRQSRTHHNALLALFSCSQREPHTGIVLENIAFALC